MAFIAIVAIFFASFLACFWILIYLILTLDHTRSWRDAIRSWNARSFRSITYLFYMYLLFIV